MKRYFDEPYRFIPPYRGNFWNRLLAPFLPNVLRKKYQIHRWRFLGADNLRKSLELDAGVLLTPNHSGFSDPPVMGLLGLDVGEYLYYLASWHLFKQSRWAHFSLNRTGAFSVFREGVDREAIRESSRILAAAERPLVVFPEGTWFRQNDRIGPLQEGVALITRKATKESQRPIVVHPVAIKYWYLDDPRPAMLEHLSRLESRLRWRPQHHLGLQERIHKLSEAFVTIKEIEHLGTPGAGDLDRRISDLSSQILSALEIKHFGRLHHGQPMDRVRGLLQALVKRLQKGRTPDERFDSERDLDDTFLCQVLFGHSQEYLAEWPSVERLAEAVKRIEEDLTRVEIDLGPLGVVVEVGEGIDVREFEPGNQPGASALVTEIAGRIQGMLDNLLDAGPPTEWGCTTGPRPKEHSPRWNATTEPLEV